MTQVFPGRYTADTDGEVTVFLIGMRVNQPWRLGSWVPVVRAMIRMQAHLARTPQAGLLGSHQWLGRTTIMVSYWESAESLQRFASDADAPHAGPWRWFRRVVGDNGAVGIWHETYVTRPGQREVVYGNMPAFGLAAATRHVPVGAGSHTARQRMSA